MALDSLGTSTLLLRCFQTRFSTRFNDFIINTNVKWPPQAESLVNTNQIAKQKTTPNDLQNGQNARKIVIFACAGYNALPWPKMAPDDLPEAPRSRQKASKNNPKGFQNHCETPKKAHESPKLAPRSPEKHSSGPKSLQDAPKRLQEATNSASKMLRKGPQATQGATKKPHSKSPSLQAAKPLSL